MDVKKVVWVMLVCLTCFFDLKAQVVAIPDSNFLNALISEGVDKNRNGKIETIEALACDTLEINTLYEIEDLSGIESFINLVVLNCSQNNIRSIDVSKNIKLKVLDCLYNQIGALDVTNNLELEILNCGSNKFKSINLSKNTKIRQLWCHFLSITSINVSNMPELTYLDCLASRLTYLDVSNNPKLTYLDVRYNASLQTICLFDTAYAKSNPKFKKDATQSWSQNCFTTGFEDKQLVSHAISIFPNPATDKVYIKGEFTKAKIYDNNGRVVLTTTVNEFSAVGLSKGIYQIVITDTKGIDKSFRLLKE